MLGRTRTDDAAQRALADAQNQIADLQRQLQVARDRDHVTGLANLGRFRAQLDIELDRARRHGRTFALALIDIDGFRMVNSHHGHAAGDGILRTLVRLLSADLRSNDLACRIGADEFAVLLPDTGFEGAIAKSQRLVDALERERVDGVDGISVSVGIVEFQREDSSPALLERAARMLAQSQRDGGGRISCSEAPGGGEEIDNEGRDAIEALAQALTERDRYTGEHSESVLDMVFGVCRTLGLSDDEIERVKYAALLHDIGKVGIPDSILNKPAKLTDEEYEIMKQHTVIGERIMRAIPGMGAVARIVRHEHERWDGRGYPDGIAGTEIPIGSRIILACDAYHAMVSDRPYRKAMPHREAIKELSTNAGTQFDPDVTEALIGHLYGQRQGAEASAA